MLSVICYPSEGRDVCGVEGLELLDGVRVKVRVKIRVEVAGVHFAGAGGVEGLVAEEHARLVVGRHVVDAARAHLAHVVVGQPGREVVEGLQGLVGEGHGPEEEEGRDVEADDVREADDPLVPLGEVAVAEEGLVGEGLVLAEHDLEGVPAEGVRQLRVQQQAQARLLAVRTHARSITLTFRLSFLKMAKPYLPTRFLLNRFLTFIFA